MAFTFDPIRFLRLVPFCFFALFCVSCSTLMAQDVLPPIDQRIRTDVNLRPDFRRHIIPLFSKLGCNGRNCHGAAKGQSGFKLSLFGHDLAADHGATLQGAPPRANWMDPRNSLLLKKPIGDLEHGGGDVMEEGGWEYQILHRWLSQRVQGVDPKSNNLAVSQLRISPSELVIEDNASAPPRLRVTAVWSDGSAEDVTPLCRFRSNDLDVVKVHDDGTLMRAGAGDTDVVAFYDRVIATMKVLAPLQHELNTNFDFPAKHEIDRIVLERLRQLRIQPSALSEDSEFLRRVCLDITGSLPTPVEVDSFLNDESSNKRDRLIDDLLSRPTYVSWWTTRLCDLFANTETQAPDYRY